MEDLWERAQEQGGVCLLELVQGSSVLPEGPSDMFKCPGPEKVDSNVDADTVLAAEEPIFKGPGRSRRLDLLTVKSQVSVLKLIKQ